jgi:hypothetical protein
MFTKRSKRPPYAPVVETKSVKETQDPDRPESRIVNQYTVHQVLGEGSYGVVSLATAGPYRYVRPWSALMVGDQGDIKVEIL